MVKRLSSLLALLAYAAFGCAPAQETGTGLSGQAAAAISSSQAPTSTPSGLAVTPEAIWPSPEVIGSATFGVPAPADLRDIEAYGWTGSYYYSARPDMSPSLAAVSPRLKSGNYIFEGAFRTPFGQTWAVESVTTARLPAVTQGQENAYVRDQIKPLVASWASDGVLDTGYTHTPDLGKMRAGVPDPFDSAMVQDEPAILKNVGWPLPYRSDGRKEMLLFYSTGVVLRVKAAPLTADQNNVKLSSQQAIQTLLAALHDPNAKSEEEQTGRDYFIGSQFATVFAPTPVGPYADVGPTFTFSDAVGWNASLDTSFADKPTWWINANGWGGYGRGLVDAETGVVIRFIRTAENHDNGQTMPSPFVPPTPFTP